MAPAREDVAPEQGVAPASEDIALEEGVAPAREDVAPEEDVAPAREDIALEEGVAPAREDVALEEDVTPVKRTFRPEQDVAPVKEVGAEGSVASRHGNKVVLSLDVNGERHDLLVPVHKTLLEVLREDLDLTGTKHGCELGECGACAVLIEGEAVLSCLALPVECQSPAQIVTVEGLADGSRPHPLQETFAELGAAQCGYCTPGMLVTAKALLDENPTPTRAQIVEALSGNLCRCTGYVKIFEAVELAASRAAT